MPQPDFTASANCRANKKLQAQAYFFTRVSKDFSTAWLLGWATSRAIETKSNYKKRGESDGHGFRYKVNGYHVPISSLRRASSLK